MMTAGKKRAALLDQGSYADYTPEYRGVKCAAKNGPVRALLK